MLINLKLQSETVKKLYPLIKKWHHASTAWQKEFANSVEMAIKEINKVEMEKQQQNKTNPLFDEIIEGAKMNKQDQEQERNKYNQSNK